MLNFGICFKGDMAAGRTVSLAQRATAGSASDTCTGFLHWIADEVVERFTIIGTADDHVRKLKALRDAGVQQFRVHQFNLY